MPAELYDRLTFAKRLREEIARSNRHGHPFCLLVLEAHLGEAIPLRRKMSMGLDVLRACLRASDVVCEAFDDTLTALLVETDRQGLRDALHRMTSRLAVKTGAWHIESYFYPERAADIEAHPLLRAS